MKLLQYTDGVLTELCMSNLRNVINHCHPNTFSFIKKKAAEEKLEHGRILKDEKIKTAGWWHAKRKYASNGLKAEFGKPGQLVLPWRQVQASIQGIGQ